MKRAIYEAALRRLTKQAGGKLRDDLRDAVRELAEEYVEEQAKPLLEKVAEFAETPDLDEVLSAVEERIERRGAEAEEFRNEAIRRATQTEEAEEQPVPEPESDEDQDAGHEPEDDDSLDGGDAADSETDVGELG